MRSSILAAVLIGFVLGVQETPAPAGPEIGKPAPQIRLNDQNGKALTVGGKCEQWTALAFYPKAATPG